MTVSGASLLLAMFPCIVVPLSVGAVQSDLVTARVSKLMASDGAEGDEFGLAVSASGTTVIVGAVGEDERGDEAGAAYIFQSRGGAWLEVAKLTASDGEAADQFGRSVSVSGDTAIVGASGDDDSGAESGAAYVFDRSGGAWVRVATAKLTASDGAANDQFGSSVSLSGNIVNRRRALRRQQRALLWLRIRVRKERWGLAGGNQADRFRRGTRTIASVCPFRCPATPPSSARPSPAAPALPTYSR